MKHEFSSNVNKVNKTVAKVRTIGDRLPLSGKKKRKTLFIKRSLMKKLNEWITKSDPFLCGNIGKVNFHN